MTQWPDPASEPGETGRRLKVGAIAGVVALSVWAVLNSDGADRFSWRLPEMRLPEFRLPDVSMPDIDLRGRASDQAGAGEAGENAASLLYDSGPSVQTIPFETCTQMLEQFATSTNQQPVVVEDTEERRVRRYKFVEGNLSVTCSRAENTLTIVQGG